MRDSSDPIGTSETQRLQEELARTKLLWDIRKVRVETILQSLALSFLLFSSVGAGLLFYYFFRNGFNPGGMSAADTWALALTAFGFSIVLGLLLFMAVLAVYPLCWAAAYGLSRYRQFRERQLKLPGGAADTIRMSKNLAGFLRVEMKKKRYITLVIGIALFAFAILVAAFGPDGLYKIVFVLLGSGACLSIFIHLRLKKGYSVLPREEATEPDFIDQWLMPLPQSVGIGIIIVVTNTPLLFFGSDQLQDISLLMLGFRAQNVSVRLAREDFIQLVEGSARAGVAVNPCQTLDKDHFIVHRMDVLWHRLGTQALLRFPSDNAISAWSSNPGIIRLEPLNSSISVLTTYATQEDCSEMLSDFLFKEGTAQLRSSAENRLQGELKWLEGAPGQKMVRVVAHGSDASSGLIYQQAEAIKRYIVTAYRLPPSSIELVDRAIAEPKLVCEEAAPLSLQMCKRISRRIEISRL